MGPDVECPRTDAMLDGAASAVERHVMQATGTHPAPCARFCEATAFGIEMRRLRGLLRDALPHVEASAEASHMTDGFRRQPENDFDRLANRIRAELHNVKLEGQPKAVPLEAPVGHEED